MRRRGLSLIEVLVTSSLLGLCALFLLSILPGAMLSVRQSEHRLGASALAKAILDECAAGPFTSVAQDGIYTMDSPGPLGEMLARQQYLTDDHTRLEPTLTVSHDPSVVAPHRLAWLRVTVAWKERNTDLQIERFLYLSSLER